MVSGAAADLAAQVSPDSKEAAELLKRYPKAKVADFDGDPSKVSELDAMIAYLQMLGTLVDFATYDNAGPNLR